MTRELRSEDMSGIKPSGAAKGGLIGGVTAGIVTTGLYFVGSALGADYKPREPEKMGMEMMAAYSPFMICMIASVVAVSIAALLGKLAGKKAWTIFLIISALVFAAEAYASIASFGDLKTIVILEIMHVPAALLIVGGIHRFGVKPLQA